VQNEKTHFNGEMRDLVTHQEFNTVNFQHKRLEHGQREETKVLVPHREPCKPALSVCLVFCERKQRDIDVGIAGDVIRRAVVRIVLVEPPTVAESEQQIGMNEANDLVACRAAEDFLMARVVNDEAQLSENKRQEGSIAEFGPRIMKQFDEQERGHEQGQIKSYLSAVIRGLLR